jgi:XTP/dITP diphosphohydrolase
MESLLSALPIEIETLTDFSGISDVEEIGTTFRENAELKSREFAKQTGRLCLADDSGLEIKVLAGQPGVHSARFAGAETGYDIKNALLVSMVDEAPEVDRRARFVCVMALSRADGETLYTAEGVCHGTIAHESRGTNGFGYDPIFIPDGFDKTFGELDDEIKRNISHRARAAEQIVRYLLDFIA